MEETLELPTDELELPTGERCEGCGSEMVISIDGASGPVLACDCCSYLVA